MAGGGDGIVVLRGTRAERQVGSALAGCASPSPATSTTEGPQYQSLPLPKRKT
jgi:hypothetical protein